VELSPFTACRHFILRGPCSD